jgi:hypothetical protein
MALHLILTMSHEVDAASWEELEMTATGVSNFDSSWVSLTLLYDLQQVTSPFQASVTSHKMERMVPDLPSLKHYCED